MNTPHNYRRTFQLTKWAIVLCSGLLCTGAMGQPTGKSFRLPNHATPADYDPQHVLVKLKPGHRDLFRQTNNRTTAAIPQEVGVVGVREFIPSRGAMTARAKQGPRRSISTIDINLYYRLACTPGTPIEEFINGLYHTGYFELVEPEYVNRMALTPNDPAQSSQYYLANIRAFEAWNETQGDESIVIAIVDSGGDLVHEDLAANVYTNPLEIIDGLDNDDNGFIDDAQGWDFVGNDLSNLSDPDFIGDNNPQLTTGGTVGHGVNVAGCASAVTDNGIGIAGVGFKTKLMFTKHSADNQPTNTGIYLGYDGILYAALSGANIINISWGGSFRSEIIQDMINFITEDLGVLLVSAVGNGGIEAPFYPAAYDNVLSVSSVNQQNTRASFTNYGTWVDIAAPGVGIFTTSFGNAYTTTQGTSFSSPIVAGAAALVMAKFPSYTPQQVAEQLRVTANSEDLNNSNPAYFGKLGKGILDIAAALTATSPSVRASKPRLLNATGAPAEAGEKGLLTLTFKNILASTTSALEISILENSPFISIVKGTIRPGAIPGGATINNNLFPFEIQISTTVPENFIMPITITYKDGTYVDQEEITFLLNPTFIDIDENLVTTTISNTGRIGYEDPESETPEKGVGFVFDNLSILYEMGIIMGTGTGTQLYNNVRGIGGNFDQDFISIGQKIKEITPGERSSSEVFGTLSNSATPASQTFQMKYRSLAWKEQPYDKFVIVEYTIANPTATALNNFYLGLFADWDITQNGTTDIAKWDNDHKLGYVYPVSAEALPHAGIQLLTGAPTHFAIDNNQAVAGNPFGLYDGFTDTEKFSSLSGGLGRAEAGVTTNGNDVSHMVGSGPYNIPAGQEIKIAFALHAAMTFDDLLLSAKYADSVYNFTLNAPMPVIADVNACYGSGATITATGATDYKWYKTFTGGTPFHTGSDFTTGNLVNDTTFFVSNADEFYESVRTAANVSIKANPAVATSGSTIICDNASLILSASDADSYLWSNGETTQTIEVGGPGIFTVTVGSLSPVCQNTSAPVEVTTMPSPLASFQIPADIKSFAPIQFTDQSTAAIAWNWDFGNEQTSTLQNPITSYMTSAPFEVKLSVKAANGCEDTSVQTIDVITGLEDFPEGLIALYPNPSRSTVFVEVDRNLSGAYSAELLTLQGQVVFRQPGLSTSGFEISVADLPDGIYVVRITVQDRIINKKVVKIH